MEHYVTLFDSLFLPQGLALHASLERHANRYTLWILCVDDMAFDTLSRLQLPNVELLTLADVENDSLRAVKATRSRGEYCWTLTPYSPKAVLDKSPAAARVTYLDADVWLVADPAPIFAEFDSSGKGVLITEHAYASEYDQTPTAGRFCVQFMTFARDRGEVVRSWWADRCIEWCFARLQDGKFGDQMYLNDWPTRFAEQVHIAKERAFFQAPWNATRFAPSEAKAYHFHGLRLLHDDRVLLASNYRIPEPTLTMVYHPYLADLRDATRRLRSTGFQVRPQAKGPGASIWGRQLLHRLANYALGAGLPRVTKL